MLLMADSNMATTDSTSNVHIDISNNLSTKKSGYSSRWSPQSHVKTNEAESERDFCPGAPGRALESQ